MGLERALCRVTSHIAQEGGDGRRAPATRPSRLWRLQPVSLPLSSESQDQRSMCAGGCGALRPHSNHMYRQQRTSPTVNTAPRATGAIDRAFRHDGVFQICVACRAAPGREGLLGT